MLLSNSTPRVSFAKLLADFITPKLRYGEAKAEGVGLEPTSPFRRQFSRLMEYHYPTPPFDGSDYH